MVQRESAKSGVFPPLEQQPALSILTTEFAASAFRWTMRRQRRLRSQNPDGKPRSTRRPEPNSMQIPGKRLFYYGLRREPHYILAFFFAGFFRARQKA